MGLEFWVGVVVGILLTVTAAIVIDQGSREP